ncbi:MAG: class I SAM-dependent methyltransferase [Clostridia bacterium]|nr:class I SAM-dependent methyltransferase [Clostridia bacterium]MBQ3814715.1 class I SAM-dependent methyltransferase [Clostridia bacterium]MBR4185304.1 class I SAM-dependent methyltransferase [Clostridia bacterium]
MNMFEYFGYFGEQTQDDRLIRTENEVIASLFDKYFPAGGTLLDSAAGRAQFCFRFAERGWEVTAGDLIADRVEALEADPRAALVKEFYCASSRNLSRFASGSFDAVISLGPIYHMSNRAEREAFVRESVRVLKDGGTFAFSFMTPFAMNIGQFLTAVRTEDNRERLKQFRKLTNVERSHNVDMFYGLTTEEMTDLSREYGLEILTVASTYGMLYNMADEVAAMDEAEYERFRKAQIATAEDPFVAKYAMRGLYIGRKKARDLFD